MKRHHLIFLALLVALAGALVLLMRARRDFYAEPERKIEFHLTDPGEPIDFSKTITI